MLRTRYILALDRHFKASGAVLKAYGQRYTIPMYSGYVSH